MEHRRPGRPSKGQRERLQLRLAPELKAAIERAAASEGMTANDYMASLAARATGIPFSPQEAMSLAS
ncbi:MAG: DUF1778 domain-containing protein [Jatrophihabitantaceae bacterium]